MDIDKKIPNPFGKKGSPKHVELVNEVADNIEKRGLFASIEYLIRLLTGKKRFIDVAGIDLNTNIPKEFHQIGKQNQDKSPIKRERNVIEEIYNETKIKVQFHAYNEIEDKNEK